MKRLFRKWLKRQIVKAHAMPEQQIFEWIYGSPIATWKNKLLCIRCHPDRWREVYSFLNSDSSSSNETCV